jgi:hypothetical protein
MLGRFITGRLSSCIEPSHAAFREVIALYLQPLNSLLSTCVELPSRLCIKDALPLGRKNKFDFTYRLNILSLYYYYSLQQVLLPSSYLLTIEAFVKILKRVAIVIYKLVLV